MVYVRFVAACPVIMNFDLDLGDGVIGAQEINVIIRRIYIYRLHAGSSSPCHIHHGSAYKQMAMPVYTGSLAEYSDFKTSR